MRTIESELKYYPPNKIFSFNDSMIKWGKRTLKWKKKTKKNTLITYFAVGRDTQSIHLKFFSNGTGEVLLQKKFNLRDAPVKFICSAGKQIKSQNKQTIVGQDTNRQPQLKISEETKPKRSALKLAFTNLSENQRKEVQFNLKNLNFYNSSIDGLYGSKTAQALEAYNSEHLGGSDLDKTGSVKRLLFSLVNATPPSETFSPME